MTIESSIIYSLVGLSLWVLVRKKWNRTLRLIWIESGEIARFLLRHHKVKWAFWIRSFGFRK